jgi:ATP-dependent Clp protease ATP-binding subunit ClpB
VLTDFLDLKEKIKENLNDLYKQVDKSTKEYIEYLQNLKSQLTQVKSSITKIQEELKRILATKRQLENELRYEESSFWGGFGSSTRFEYERITRYENELKGKLEQIKSSLLNVMDEQAASAFINGEISLSAVLYKVIEKSDFIKQIDEIGLSPDRVIVKITEEVLGTKSGKIYANKLIKVMEDAEKKALESGEAQVKPLYIASSLIDNTNTIAGKILQQILTGGEKEMKGENIQKEMA